MRKSLHQFISNKFDNFTSSLLKFLIYSISEEENKYKEDQKVNGDIERRKYRKEDPELYIKKAFGKNFEFSEEYLTSNIESESIIKAIKSRYGFK